MKGVNRGWVRVWALMSKHLGSTLAMLLCNCVLPLLCVSDQEKQVIKCLGGVCPLARSSWGWALLTTTMMIFHMGNRNGSTSTGFFNNDDKTIIAQNSKAAFRILCLSPSKKPSHNRHQMQIQFLRKTLWPNPLCDICLPPWVIERPPSSLFRCLSTHIAHQTVEKARLLLSKLRFCTHASF